LKSSIEEERGGIPFEKRETTRRAACCTCKKSRRRGAAENATTMVFRVLGGRCSKCYRKKRAEVRQAGSNVVQKEGHLEGVSQPFPLIEGSLEETRNRRRKSAVESGPKELTR